MTTYVRGSGIETPNIDSESYNQGPIGGFRNAIINGNFNINQRGYVSGSATTAGQYTLDRWAVTGIGGITLSTSENKTTVTIPAGQTIKQVIEGVNLQTGKYVLSWKGTAQGRVNGGSYGSSGLVVADVVGGVNTTIEFNSGTVTDVQFEPGRIATVFGSIPLDLEEARCYRYYEKSYNYEDKPGTLTFNGAVSAATQTGGTNTVAILVTFRVAKRITPAVVTYNPSTGTIGQMTDAGGVNIATQVFGTAGKKAVVFRNSGGTMSINSIAYAHWVADAEIPI